MRLKVYALIGFFFILMGEALAASPDSSDTNHEITANSLKTHINFLCSNALAGRLTGSAGEKRADQYIATFFQRLGLKPAGDHGTYFQEFNFTAGGALGKHNTLTLINRQGVARHLTLNQEWRPLSFSDNTSFNNIEMVFAGYGITAPAFENLAAYDSYAGLNVKNKWVIVFRSVPAKLNDKQKQQINSYSSLRYKAFNAKEHGAKGIIFVSAPDEKTKNELIPLSFDTSLTGSGIVAISVLNSVIKNISLNANNLHRRPAACPRDPERHLQPPDPADKPRDDGDDMTCSLLILNSMKITGQTDIQKKIQHGRNVLAALKVNTNAPQILIIGAHVDHLGHGELGGSRARDSETGMIHPGADDNASGVASMLEAAAQLSNLNAHGRLLGNKNILFAAWSGEEIGVLGSSYFVKKFARKKTDTPQHIAAAINLDMVGHLQKHLVLQGVGSSSDWPTIFAKMNMKQSISFITQKDPYLPTDSTSFYLHGVPAINFFTGATDNYHTPRDTANTLNYKGMKNVSDFLVNLVIALESTSNKIAYQKIPKPSDHTERQFNIYLGTIPDYASADAIGVKLAGVAKNSPAEQAKMKQDDVIIELAGKKIHDIYDYTFVLNALHAGEPVKLVVLRRKTKIELKIVPRNRD